MAGMKRSLFAIFVIAFALQLGGCAVPRVVDSEVRAYSRLPGITAPATYRIERLMSQQAPDAAQAVYEQMLVASLLRVGMRPDEQNPAYGIQFAVREQKLDRSIWDDPMRLVYRRPGPGWNLFGGMPLSYYLREVTMVMRDLGTGHVVFETRAYHEGRWPDSLQVLPAMFRAALADFPQPPTGTRTIDIVIEP